MYDYDDFYYEPSEADDVIEQFKEKLRKEVKQEIQDEMNRLKEENEKYRDLKDAHLDLTKEKEKLAGMYRLKSLNLENELRQELKKATIGEIFSDFQYIAYRVDVKVTKKDKCNKCDADRKLQYETPLGRKLWEYCECSKRVYSYVVQECMMCSIEKSQYVESGVKISYAPYSIESDGDIMLETEYLEDLRRLSEFYNNQDFEEIERQPWITLFKTKEKAQEFADYLNKKAG